MQRVRSRKLWYGSYQLRASPSGRSEDVRSCGIQSPSRWLLPTASSFPVHLVRYLLAEMHQLPFLPFSLSHTSELTSTFRLPSNNLFSPLPNEPRNAPLDRWDRHEIGIKQLQFLVSFLLALSPLQAHLDELLLQTHQLPRSLTPSSRTHLVTPTRFGPSKACILHA